MADDRSQQPGFVHTFSLFGYLLTVVAWELEAGALLLLVRGFLFLTMLLGYPGVLAIAGDQPADAQR
jgi:hypothetical protein